MLLLKYYQNTINYTMAKIIGILIKEDEPQDSGGCVVALVAAVIIGIVGWWGYVKVHNWMIGPDAVKKERVESLKKERQEILEKSKEEKDPFADHTNPSKKPQRLVEVEKELNSLNKELKEKNAKASKPHQDELSKVESSNNQSTLTTLEGISLPQMIVTTDSVNLLNEANREVLIPSGTTIKVLSRAPKGTLVTEINGTTFVGNEGRLSGKIRKR
jgi:hypothetical protein